MELRRHRRVTLPSRFSYSALSSQHSGPLVITLLLTNSLEIQAYCLRNGKFAPHHLSHLQLRNSASTHDPIPERLNPSVREFKYFLDGDPQCAYPLHYSLLYDLGSDQLFSSV